MTESGKKILEEKKEIKYEIQEIKINSSSNESFLSSSYIPNYSENDLNAILKLYKNEQYQLLKNQLDNVDCSYEDCDNEITFDCVCYVSSLDKIFKEKKNYALMKKLKSLKNIFCRKIKGDGNCFYRSVIFAYVEEIILNKKLFRLKDLICDINNQFKEEKLRNILKKNDIDEKNILLCLLLIYLTLSLKNDYSIFQSYEYFIKCINNIPLFDYGLIFYFRIIIFKYIEKNEDKLFAETFPVNLGNLLPNEYETEDEIFLFNKFYDEFLLKLYKDAEKIVIYVTPFILDINFNILIFEDVTQSLSSMKFINNDNLNYINILLKYGHYDLIYNEKYFLKFKNYFSIFYEGEDTIDAATVNMTIINDEVSNYVRKTDYNNYRILNTDNNLNKSSSNHNSFSSDSSIIFNDSFIKSDFEKKKKHSKGVSLNPKNKKNLNNQINKFSFRKKIISKKPKKFIPTTLEIKNIIKINNAFNEEKVKKIAKESKKIKINLTLINNISQKSKEEHILIEKEKEKEKNKKLEEEKRKILEKAKKNKKEENKCLDCGKIIKKNEINEFKLCNNCLKNALIENIIKLYEINFKQNQKKLLNNGKLIELKFDCNKIIISEKETFPNFVIYTLKQNGFDENLTYEKIQNEIKKKMCSYCFDSKKEKQKNLPCGCNFCNNLCLSKFLQQIKFSFNEKKNVNSTNNSNDVDYFCLCGKKYDIKDINNLIVILGKIKNEGLLKEINKLYEFKNSNKSSSVVNYGNKFENNLSNKNSGLLV